MYNNSSTIGDMGEAVAIAEFVKRGVCVLTPFGQNVPYDLVIHINNQFLRIQCKTCQKVNEIGSMKFNICRTDGFTGSHKQYTKNDIDYFCLYCVENNYIGLVPVEETGSRAFTIRTQMPQNNQMAGIHHADDYTFDKQLKLIMTQ